jgi:hypothetical protein
VNRDYDGRQYVGIDLHRRRSVIVQMTPDGEQLGWVRINNDPVALWSELAKAGPAPGGGARQLQPWWIGPSFACAITSSAWKQPTEQPSRRTTTDVMGRSATAGSPIASTPLPTRNA